MMHKTNSRRCDDRIVSISQPHVRPIIRGKHYPEKVLVDPLYGTRENRHYLKEKGIHYAGKPLGRPKKETEENKAQLKQEKQQRRNDYCQRIPIEGKFGQGKSAYGLDKIKAKTAKHPLPGSTASFLS